MRKVLKYIILIVLCVAVFISICFIILGYLNSYIGYYGYNKHKYRRYSETIEESMKRETLVSKLNYENVSIKINNVFLEKAFKWGSSSDETIYLTPTDTFSDNNPELPYQIIISFIEKQGDSLIYIPDNFKIVSDSFLRDTLFFEIYIRNNKQELITTDTLKIWE